MKLSIISLVNKSARDVNSFLKHLKYQENQDFEIILCLNNNKNTQKIINEINEYYSFFNSRLKLIYNFKNISNQYNLLSSFNVISGDYVVVLNSDNKLKKHYIDKMIKDSQEYDVDILEYQPRIIGSIRWKPKQRLDISQKLSIRKQKEIIAYSYPFIFNKIYKRTLVQKVFEYSPKNLNDTKMCVELNYLLLLNADTYFYLNYRIHREQFNSNIWFNTHKIAQSFENVEKITNSIWKDFWNDELAYAKYYLVKLVLTAFLNETFFLYKKFYKNQRSLIKERKTILMIQKHYEVLKKLEKDFNKTDFINQNKYMLKKTTETYLLQSKYEKLIKEKILSSLE
ncbi:glycosyltransferase [Mycoplasmopsis felis]|uniref:glycosyltransferase n=2 Tax=Mycoplasmopsis felis TaxID=33923 RepID=UPI002DD42FC8|nr:glycosyltransferase [Mycoplasmopsis felis]WRX06983.1 glycosyltransferase [Mycoplasmopsis felis]